MSHTNVHVLDLSIDEKNYEKDALNVLKSIRQEWKSEEVIFKVRQAEKKCYSTSQGALQLVIQLVVDQA